MPVYSISIGLNGLFITLGGVDPWKNVKRLQKTYRYTVDLPFPDPRDGYVMEYHSKGYVDYGNESKEYVKDTPSFPYRVRIDVKKVRLSNLWLNLLRIHPDGTTDVSVCHFLGTAKTHIGFLKHTNKYPADFIEFFDAANNKVDLWPLGKKEA